MFTEDLLTCPVCDREEDKDKMVYCEECGQYVCRDHAVRVEDYYLCHGHAEMERIAA